MSNNQIARTTFLRKPTWIKTKLAGEGLYARTESAIHQKLLHTVCEEAKCPNRNECWSRGTATFMLLGDTCTRACAFCAVKNGRPTFDASDEPCRIAEAVAAMELKYVVLTSVNRDDLPDGGASVFVDTLRELRQRWPRIGIEFLTPDFRNCQDNAVYEVDRMLRSISRNANQILVWGHNIETVPRLYRCVKKGAKYQRSLTLLKKIAGLESVECKSALMLGLGETHEEVVEVLSDLRLSGVKRISLGQYLQPTSHHLPVFRYLALHEFTDYKLIARQLGFTWVQAGPLVRSSYHAEA